MKDNSVKPSFWPEHKVYLFGQISFLHDVIEHKAMRKERLRQYVQPLNEEDRMASAVNEYVKAGYFKLNHVSGSRNERMFMLSDIDRPRFERELYAYLKSVKNALAEDEKQKIWEIAAEQYSKNGFHPKVAWTSVYGNSPRYNYSPPFWELIFTSAMDKRIKIEGIHYTSTAPYLMTNESFKPMPKEMLPFYVRPVAEFEILDRVVRNKVAKKQKDITHKAALVLTRSNRHLKLSLDGVQYPLKRFASAKNNTFRCVSTLYDANVPLTLAELNLKPNSKSKMKDLLNNAGLAGIIGATFISQGYDAVSHRPTVQMYRKVNVNEEEFDKLAEHVRSVSHSLE